MQVKRELLEVAARLIEIANKLEKPKRKKKKGSNVIPLKNLHEKLLAAGCGFAGCAQEILSHLG